MDKLREGSETAPPTVAPARPAREVAHELICKARDEPWCRDFFDGQGLPKPGENYDGYHGAQCDDFTAHLAERDRAGRSPGQAETKNPCVNCRGTGLCWIDCPACDGEMVATGMRLAAKQEGVQAAESPPLSGLDAATVEACAKLVDDAAVAYKMTWEERVLFDRLAARIRALATPPGQTKP